MPDISQQQLEGLSPESIEELRRAAEECLNGTVAFAIAADQRATTLAGIFGAGAIGAAAAYFAIPQAVDMTLGWAIGALGFLLFAASMIAATASGPSDFHVAGYEPRNRLAVAVNPDWLAQDAVIDLQRRIDANRNALISASTAANYAIWTAVAALPVAAAVYVFI